jgi:SAM-dependent methyltransferase
MTSDQELFAKGLATYQKVIAGNHFDHEQVYNLLREVLLKNAKDGFVFADLACGHSPYSAAALAGTGVARYVGVDISTPALDLAKEALAPLSCPIELRCQDFVESIDGWEGPLDVVWIGLSLHHLHTSEKRAFIRKVERLLPRDGVFLIWEPTCLEGEDRESWVKRFGQFLNGLPFSNDECAALDSHQRASDHPETAAAWKEMAREAGFEQAHALLAPVNEFTGVYLFRH